LTEPWLLLLLLFLFQTLITWYTEIISIDVIWCCQYWTFNPIDLLWFRFLWLETCSITYFFVVCAKSNASLFHIQFEWYYGFVLAFAHSIQFDNIIYNMKTVMWCTSPFQTSRQQTIPFIMFSFDMNGNKKNKHTH
jgi:hypothetical protein